MANKMNNGSFSQKNAKRMQGKHAKAARYPKDPKAMPDRAKGGKKGEDETVVTPPRNPSKGKKGSKVARYAAGMGA